ncbi:MAG: TraB/GumN family protein [Pseudomonadota bacterium]
MTRRLLTTLLTLLALPALGEHPLSLWEVRGTNNAIYLLGSVHLLRQQDHPLPSRMLDAYADAETIIMEIDMDDIDPIETQALINRLGVLNDGRTLKDLIGESRYAAAEKAAAAMDIPFGLLSRSEPWLAAMTIEQLALARLGFNPALGVEMTFSTRAAADGKPVEGFETIEQQLAFLDELSLDAQTDLLMQTLTESRDLRSEMDALIEAWRLGDIDFLEQTVLSDIKDFPELYDVIVADRNARWVDTINTLLDDDDDYLIIVGALHLVGPDGVPALLEAQGNDVTQLNQTE